MDTMDLREAPSTPAQQARAHDEWANRQAMGRSDSGDDRENDRGQEPIAGAANLLESVGEEVVTTADILRGLLERARLPWLLRHHQRRVVLAIFSVLMGAVSLAIISVIALITRSPFVFPSLGPTAFLFFYRPAAPAASPRNTLAGSAIGIAAGYLSLAVTGLVGAPPAALLGVTWPRVGAVALSFALTTALLVLWEVEHPPALATTLVVALGAFAQPVSLVTLYGGVVLLTLQAILINRAAGLSYPLWAPQPRAVERSLREEPEMRRQGSGEKVDSRCGDEV